MPPPNHKKTVEVVRKKYGPLPTKNECVEICNEVAWIHRAEGFGVAEKTGGTRGQRHDGHWCSIDGVVYRPPGATNDDRDQFIDILVGADNATPPRAVPAWQVYAASNRKWIAPIVPTDPAPDPDPGPSPGPGPDPNTYVTRVELQAALAAYDKTVEARFVTMRNDVEEQLRLLSARVARLENTSSIELDVILNAVAAGIVVDTHRTGSTGFSFGAHSHGVDAGTPLKRK